MYEKNKSNLGGINYRSVRERDQIRTVGEIMCVNTIYVGDNLSSSSWCKYRLLNNSFLFTIRLTVTSTLIMSPSSRGRSSGIPWHATLFTDVHTDFGKPL